MRTFLAVSVGTVVAAVTLACLLVVVAGLATEEYALARAGAVLWGLWAVLVLGGWLVWKGSVTLGGWVWRRRSSPEWDAWVRRRGGY